MLTDRPIGLTRLALRTQKAKTFLAPSRVLSPFELTRGLFSFLLQANIILTLIKAFVNVF